MNTSTFIVPSHLHIIGQVPKLIKLVSGDELLSWVLAPTPDYLAEHNDVAHMIFLGRPLQVVVQYTRYDAEYFFRRWQPLTDNEFIAIDYTHVISMSNISAQTIEAFHRKSELLYNNEQRASIQPPSHDREPTDEELDAIEREERDTQEAQMPYDDAQIDEDDSNLAGEPQTLSSSYPVMTTDQRQRFAQSEGERNVSAFFTHLLSHYRPKIVH